MVRDRDGESVGLGLGAVLELVRMMVVRMMVVGMMVMVMARLSVQ